MRKFLIYISEGEPLRAVSADFNPRAGDKLTLPSIGLCLSIDRVSGAIPARFDARMYEAVLLCSIGGR